MKPVRSVSEYRKAWQRFRANKPAFAALCFLAAALFTAFFGYGIVPDKSPDANTQLVEIALRPPGFRAALLPVALPRQSAATAWYEVLWHGRPVAARLIPVREESVRISGDSIYFNRIGNAKTEAIHLVQRFSTVRDSIRTDGGAFVFYTAEGLPRRLERDALQEKWNAGEALQMRTFPLGTDKYGRCMFSRLVLGFRVSLFVGGIAVAISLTLGLILGVLGGYLGGRVDELVMLIVNTVWSIPTLLLVFAIVLALGRGIGVIFLAVGLTMWVDVARIVRGQTLALREAPFIEAAQSMGLKTGRILFRHILPNLLGPVMVVAAGNFATAILLESGLSYLGFGVQPPAPSWGSMLNENYGYAIGGKPLLALAPALTIALNVLAFNLIGNGLRDALDVKNRV